MYLLPTANARTRQCNVYIGGHVESIVPSQKFKKNARHILKQDWPGYDHLSEWWLILMECVAHFL